MKIANKLLFIFILFISDSALAFDEVRDGFLIGVGGGLGHTHNDYRYNNASYLTDSESGLTATFKIGGGIGDQYALYFVHNDSWFRGHVTTGGTNKETPAVISMDGIGVSYFFEPKAPSGYIHAALGSSFFAYPREKYSLSRSGGALMLGGGYEFKQHLMFEVTLLGSRVYDQDDKLYQTSSNALQFTLNYMFY